MALNTTHFAVLTREAVHDSVRRRVVLVIAAVCFLSLALVSNCTTCDAELQVSTEFDFAGRAAIVVLCLFGLWTMVLAGLLASDQLAQSMVDGRALLVLSRPVSRDTFVLSRLAGALVVCCAAALLLMGGAAFFLIMWGGFPVLPALLALLATVLSCVTVAALAMSISLYLPRVATFMIVMVLIGIVGGTNLVALSTGYVSGLYANIHAYGPPLASSIVLALGPWASDTPGVGGLSVVVRLFAWAAGCVGVLLLNFRHQETH